MGIVLLDQVNQFYALLLRLCHGQHIAEAHNGIEGSPNLMRHIGQECRLQAVAFLCLITGVYQGLLYGLLLVNTHRRADNDNRLAFQIALLDHGKRLPPPCLAVLGSHLILLVELLNPALQQVLHSRRHLLFLFRQQIATEHLHVRA